MTTHDYTRVEVFMISGVWSEQPKVTVVDGGNAEYVCYASGNTDVMKATLNYPGGAQATVRIFLFFFFSLSFRISGWMLSDIMSCIIIVAFLQNLAPISDKTIINIKHRRLGLTKVITCR